MSWSEVGPPAPPPPPKKKKEDSPNCSSSVFVCSALSASWIIFWSCFSWSSPKKLRAAPPPRRGPRLAAETHSAPRHPGSSIVALLHAAAPLPWPCACTMVAHLLVPQSLAVRPPTPPTERTAPMPTMLALVSVARRPPAPDPLCVAPRAAMVVGKVTSLSEKENRRSRVATGPAGGQQGSRAEQSRADHEGGDQPPRAATFGALPREEVRAPPPPIRTSARGPPSPVRGGRSAWRGRR